MIIKERLIRRVVFASILAIVVSFIGCDAGPQQPQTPAVVDSDTGAQDQTFLDSGDNPNTDAHSVTNRENLVDSQFKGTELVAPGSFEKWGETTPERWQIMRGEIFEAKGKDGSALGLRPHVDNTVVIKHLRTERPLRGSKLRLSMDLMAPADRTLVSFMIVSGSENDRRLTADPLTGVPGWFFLISSGSWETVTAEIDLGESVDLSSLKLFLQLNHRAESEALIDNVSLLASE
ncbi:MAG TPA: hypothetical protein EYN96_03005 [Candidatus Hydrogenedentes bacterium]|nr:hypothetical protein [Candidatus Hydrogenedentota bacterium]